MQGWLPPPGTDLSLWWPIVALAALATALLAHAAVTGLLTGRVRYRGHEYQGRAARVVAAVLACIAGVGALLVLRAALHHLGAS